MTPLSRQPVKVCTTLRLPHLLPTTLPFFLKLSQHLMIVANRVSRQTSLLRQMSQKSSQLGVGCLDRVSFQAAALARALAVLALLGLRGSRGGKSKETFPSFHIRNAEKGRLVLLEINFSNRAVFPFLRRSCTSGTVISRLRIFFETLNVHVAGFATLCSQTYRS